MKFYKFSDWVKEAEPSCIPTIGMIKKWFYSKNSYSTSNFPSTGIYRSGGWAFNFRDELKKYIVCDNTGHLEEFWAPNKTCLRNLLGGRIRYIVDVPKKYY